MDIKNETPSKSKNPIVNRVLTGSRNNCDSPFRFLPNVSTPPSRFTRIINPFEPHLIDRLHLPTFSPSVFAQVSTPKTDEKFKWSIEDISSLKPADIDEATVSQQVFEQDPTIESIMQEKINKFFNHKIIVPSPFTEDLKRTALIKESPMLKAQPQLCHGSAQTILSLPPKLPPDVEKVLAPYFNYVQDQQDNLESSLYRKLFDCEKDEHIASLESSPALSTGLSPIQLSPEFNRSANFDASVDRPELRECNLSPIGRSPRSSRSACRLSFSGHMSLENSIAVPDVNHLPDQSAAYADLDQHCSLPELSNTSMNWDIEHKQVSILSRTPTSSPEMMEDCNSVTPHSKIFTSQRKRLSDSFKYDVEMEDETALRRLKEKLWSNDGTADTGYLTGGSSTWSANHMYASTPTKNN